MHATELFWVMRLAFQVCLWWIVAPSIAVTLMLPDLVAAFPINAPNARTLFGGFTLGSFRFRVTREATFYPPGGAAPDR